MYSYADLLVEVYLYMCTAFACTSVCICLPLFLCFEDWVCLNSLHGATGSPLGHPFESLLTIQHDVITYWLWTVHITALSSSFFYPLWVNKGKQCTVCYIVITWSHITLLRGFYYQGSDIRYASEWRSVFNWLFIRFGSLLLEPSCRTLVSASSLLILSKSGQLWWSIKDRTCANKEIILCWE